MDDVCFRSAYCGVGNCSGVGSVVVEGGDATTGIQLVPMTNGGRVRGRDVISMGGGSWKQ